MHNIDRNLAEFDTEIDTYETEPEFEFEFDDSEYVFDEAEEMELAAELLEATDEYELDQFLGKVGSASDCSQETCTRAATAKHSSKPRDDTRWKRA
jgi:hypothetical protein